MRHPHPERSGAAGDHQRSGRKLRQGLHAVAARIDPRDRRTAAERPARRPSADREDRPAGEDDLVDGKPGDPYMRDHPTPHRIHASHAQEAFGHPHGTGPDGHAADRVGWEPNGRLDPREARVDPCQHAAVARDPDCVLADGDVLGKEGVVAGHEGEGQRQTEARRHPERRGIESANGVPPEVGCEDAGLSCGQGARVGQLRRSDDVSVPGIDTNDSADAPATLAGAAAIADEGP